MRYTLYGIHVSPYGGRVSRGIPLGHNIPIVYYEVQSHLMIVSHGVPDGMVLNGVPYTLVEHTYPMVCCTANFTGACTPR